MLAPGSAVPAFARFVCDTAKAGIRLKLPAR